MVVQVWGCISDDHGVHDQINYTSLFCGPWNTPVDAYKCCFTDLCNKGLRITLESENVTESETVTPLPSVAYTQPHSGKLRHDIFKDSGYFLVSVVLMLLQLLPDHM